MPEFTKKQKETIKKIYKTFKAAGFDDISIAGMLGNALSESSFNPDSISKSNYHGLFQNSKQLRDAVVGLYGDHSLDNQLKYVIDWTNGHQSIRKGKYSGYTAMGSGKYKKAGYKTVEDAADAFMKQYERPVIMKNGKIVGYQKDAERKANAALMYDYINNTFNGLIVTKVSPDGNKVMYFPKPDYTKGEKRIQKRDVIQKPAVQDFPLNSEDRTAPSLDSWNGANSPAYGGNTPRIKGIQEYMNDQQNELNRVLPDTLVIGNLPTASIFPSLDQLMSYGKELFVRGITGAPSIYDNALNNPTINKFLIPTLYANKGKDLPGHRGGNDLVLKYDKFVENDPYYIATALSYLPIIGTAMDIREAVKNPTAENIGYAALSGITDLVGGRLFSKVAGNIIKAKKTAKAVKKAELNHWRNTPFYLSMPKELAERTVKYYAQRAADEVLDAANITGEFIPEARLVPAASVYFPDFMANMSLHKHNKGKDLPKYAPGKDDEQVERGGITYNVHPSALTEKEMLNVEIPNTNVRSTPGMLRAREIRNENARIMAQRFLEQHPFGPNTPPIEPGLELIHPEFEALLAARAIAQYGLRSATRPKVYGNDAVNTAEENAASRALERRWEPEEFDDFFMLHSPQDYYGTNFDKYPYYVEESLNNSVYPRMRAMRPNLTDEQFSGAFKTAADGKYTVYPDKTFKRAYGENTTLQGTYYPESNHTAIREGSQRYALGHEERHKLAEFFPSTKEERKYLSDAFDDDFIALSKEGKYKGYDMDAERATTNYDARKELLGDDAEQKLSLAQQNYRILNATDDEIFEAVEYSNGYGNAYITQKRADGKLTPQLANRIRQAMMKVGVGAVGTNALYNSMQDAGILAPQQILVDGLNNYNKGKDIYIKPSKRGTFTAAAKKRGKSVQEFANQVLANPGNYSPAMRKKALFARNAKKFKH